MEFKNQWDVDEDNTSKPETETKSEQLRDESSVDLEKVADTSDEPEQQHAPESDTSVDLEKHDIATENSLKKSLPTNNLASLYPEPKSSAASPFAARILSSTTTNASDDTHKARRFLVAYITTAFSALSILYGTAWLGYVLIDHFLGPKQNSDGWFYIDFAPLYISLMASLAVFGAIYIVASRYVAKSASDDTIGLKDWRAYKVVYAFFSALLIATGASIVAGLVYIPLAQLMIADDLDSKRILVQTIASIHVLAWIAVLIWQERLVKKAKQSWLQGFVVVAGVAIVVIATGIFPVGSKTDERFDNRVASDLSAIQSAISDYKDANKKLPDGLASLTFQEDDTAKDRLKDYVYTLKTPTQADSQNESAQQRAKVNATVLNNNSDNSEDSELTDEEYYESLYETMYSNSSRSTSAAQSYELCATFRTDTTAKKDSSGNALINSLSGSSSSYSFTSHKAGNVCFTRN